MISVRLSAKQAREALALMRGELPAFAAALVRGRVGAALERALAAQKGKTRKLSRRSSAARRDETSAIYAAVSQRAAGTCEGCGQPFSPADPPELDHFWGRRKAPQSVANCWMLHRSCHRHKTENKPSAADWLWRFADHAEGHGYRVERGHALSRLDGLVALRNGRGGA